MKKLVRDKIPEIIEAKGETVNYTVASDWEYWIYLKEKLADIEEVLIAIREYKGLFEEKIELVRVKKQKERGGFKKKYILEQ